MKHLKIYFVCLFWTVIWHQKVCRKSSEPKLFYDSELNQGKPFRYKKDTSKYKLNKMNVKLLDKNIKDSKLKNHIWEILKVIAVYSLVNDQKYNKGPRYLKLSSKDINSRLLIDKIDKLVKLPLLRRGYSDYIDSIYALSDRDIDRARKVNIFDTSSKRKDRLEELERNLNDSLDRNKRKRNAKKKFIELDRNLGEETGESIENILMSKTHSRPLRVTNAPVERFLKQRSSHSRRKSKTQRNHSEPQKKWKRRGRVRKLRKFRKLKRRHPKKHLQRLKLKENRKLTTKLVNPVHHHHHRQTFGIPGAGGGGGVTQGAGVENLKVVINAIGQPSTYLPVEQNDSYKKGYKEADAEPKVIVTRLKLPGRIGQ